MPPSRRLTKREQEVADLLIQGMMNKEIGEALGLSLRSVKGHRAKVFKKFGVRSAVELVHISEAEPMGWQTDAAGLTTEVDDKLAEFVGIPKNQLLGHDWIAIVHPEHREMILQTWEKSLQGRSAQAHPYRLRRADGTYHWVFSVAIPRFRSGRYIGHVGSLFLIEPYLERWLKLLSSHQELLVLAASITLLLASIYDNVAQAV
jgi:PAS domain S-box-containing protein